jgi:NAD(P)-dependent dehydrogenase (short-subunit alcohol dehydrogenase family)
MGKQVSRTVVVTGASRGIGRATALRFARHGDRVWALARSKDALTTLEGEGEGRIRGAVIDLTREADIADICSRILNETGCPSVLVNNAGMAISAPLQRTPLADFERVLSVNLRAPFLFCQAFLPAMAEAGFGRVVNVASTAGLKGFRCASAYGASKHGLVGLTKSLAVEFASQAVTVNAVCPGWTDTEMLTSAARTTVLSKNPIGRLVRPEEVAELCFFLAGHEASAINGACYTVDGGETA